MCPRGPRTPIRPRSAIGTPRPSLTKATRHTPVRRPSSRRQRLPTAAPASGRGGGGSRPSPRRSPRPHGERILDRHPALPFVGMASTSAIPSCSCRPAPSPSPGTRGSRGTRCVSHLLSTPGSRRSRTDSRRRRCRSRAGRRPRAPGRPGRSRPSRPRCPAATTTGLRHGLVRRGRRAPPPHQQHAPAAGEPQADAGVREAEASPPSSRAPSSTRPDRSASCGRDSRLASTSRRARHACALTGIDPYDECRTPVTKPSDFAARETPPPDHSSARWPTGLMAEGERPSARSCSG